MLYGFLGAPWEVLIVALVALLLFGNRLPNVMRNLGSGINEFKKGVDAATEPLKELDRQGRDIARTIKK